jgi:hypothetical protein
VYRQVLWFLECHNQMLCIVLVKLQVDMFTHSSSLNFYKSKEMKYQKILKCYNRKGDKLQMELEWKWTSYNFECTKKKGSHRKLTKEVLTWTMNPPHCLTQKCQKLSQLSSSWTLASKPAPNESHQQQIRA